MVAIPAVPISQYCAHADLILRPARLELRPTARSPTEFERQAELALDTLAAHLKEAGASLASVLKANVFITRRTDFEAMNRVCANRFGAPWPVRTTVVVDLALPELLFEIEVVAHGRVPDPVVDERSVGR